jgi:queuine tRNA-ribosyltransferase
MRRTLRWSERALAAKRRTDQALFGIVQGGTDPELRRESARGTAALGFPGFGIGGLSVGESPGERDQVLEIMAAELPPDRVRYVMGLGDPLGLLDAIARGMDLFDCVLPTRLARHGRVFAKGGDLNLRRAQFASDTRPIDESCRCHTCATHHRSYLRHLLTTQELSAYRLLSIHNLVFILDLMVAARAAIIGGRFESLRETLTSRSLRRTSSQ